MIRFVLSVLIFLSKSHAHTHTQIVHFSSIHVMYTAMFFLLSSSESSSHIEEKNSHLTTTFPSQQESSTADPTSPPPDSASSPSTRVPSSLIYDLSSKTVRQASDHTYLVPPHQCKLYHSTTMKLTSFSRELAKQPLKVLKRQQHNAAKVEKSQASKRDEHWQEMYCSTASGTRQNVHSTAPLSTTKPAALHHHLHPTRQHAKHHSPSNARNSFGNTVVLEIPYEDPFTKGTTELQTNVIKRTHALNPRIPPVDNTLVLQQPESHPDVHSLSPRMVTFQAGVVGKGELCSEALHSKDQLVDAKLCGKVAQVCASTYHLPISSNRTLSEGTATLYSLDFGESSQCRALSTTSQEIVHGSRTEPDGRVAQPETELQLRASASPDYMLVGAHFTGNHLVLMDSDGQVVHQLTDTESEGNILASAGSNYDTSYGAITALEPSPTETEKGWQVEYTVTCDDGIRAPPSTASNSALPRTKQPSTSASHNNHPASQDMSHLPDNIEMCHGNSAGDKTEQQQQQRGSIQVSPHTAAYTVTRQSQCSATNLNPDSRSIHTQSHFGDSKNHGIMTLPHDAKTNVQCETHDNLDTISIPSETVTGQEGDNDNVSTGIAYPRETTNEQHKTKGNHIDVLTGGKTPVTSREQTDANECTAAENLITEHDSMKEQCH